MLEQTFSYERPCYRGQEFRKKSVNEDLESLFEDLRLGKEPDEDTETYFLPKLTEEELELVEKDTYFTSFYHFLPEVPKAEWILSKSDSKYVDGVAWRKTFTIHYPVMADSDIVGNVGTLETQEPDKDNKTLFSTVSNKTNDELLQIQSKSRKVTFAS